jgi:hypothetical protein
MAGSTATLSVNISNSLLTTVTWTAYYATTADTFGTLASPTRTQISTGTFTVTSTLTNYSTQISIPAAATTGIEVVFTVGAQTSGTWVIGNVQLEKSSTATSFDYRPYGTELALAQRYCFRKNSTGANSIGLPGGMYSGSLGIASDFYHTQMRAVPVFSFDGTLANWSFSLNNTSIVITSLALSGTSGVSGAILQFACAATVGFSGALTSVNSSAWLQYTAEL